MAGLSDEGFAAAEMALALSALPAEAWVRDCVLVGVAADEGLSIDALAGAVGKPEWDKARRNSDWRNHVHSSFKEMWGSLRIETRVAIFISAAIAAREE